MEIYPLYFEEDDVLNIMLNTFPLEYEYQIN
jgi:hypothetical protein